MSRGNNVIRRSAILMMVAVLMVVLTACGTTTAALPEPTEVQSVESTEEVVSQQPAEADGSSAETFEEPYDENADAYADIDAALTAAKADQKYVLLDFGANWCLDCIVLSALFEDPKVKPTLDENYHVVQIDVGEWDRNLDVSDKYGNPIEKGIPAIVVLTPDGEIVASTKAGELATARSATADDILAYLQAWAPKS